MPKKIQTDTGDGFLARWSAKKSQSDQPLVPANDVLEDDAKVRQPEVEEPEIADLPHVDSADDQKQLGDEDMPDIESLDENSDYSGFLSPGVSDELRRLALRKLFRSQVFNVRDGLDDYDDDFRSFTALGDLITSDMKHQMELAEERKREMEAADDRGIAGDENSGADAPPGEGQAQRQDAAGAETGHQAPGNETAKTGEGPADQQADKGESHAASDSQAHGDIAAPDRRQDPQSA